MLPTAFQVTVSDFEGGHRVCVSGELDAAAASQLHVALQDLVGRGPASGAGDVSVDLAGVGFVDSTGLGTLVKAAGQLRRQSRRLVVQRPSPEVRRLFELSGLAALVAE